MTTTTQLDLFADQKPRDACGTCGAIRPDGYPRALFLEPVSGECFDCNHATAAEIMRATLAGEQAALDAARRRHGHKPGGRG